MKQILIAALILVSFKSYSQNDVKVPINPLLVNGKLPIDSFYEDKAELLITSKVVIFDSIKQADLLRKVKNWSSTKFISLKDVLVSETDNQLTINYIDNSFYSKTFVGITYIKFYVRLVVQFKDGKIKYSFHDDGIVADIAASISARAYHIKDYFKEKDGQYSSQKNNTEGMLAFKNSILATLFSANKYITNQEKSKDW